MVHSLERAARQPVRSAGQKLGGGEKIWLWRGRGGARAKAYFFAAAMFLAGAPRLSLIHI